MVESPSVVAAEHGSLRRESSRSVAWRDLNEPDHAERVGQPRARSGLLWAPTLPRSLHFVDELARQIAECEAELRSMGADHPDIELLRTIPGIGWVLGYTIASEIGEHRRFGSPKKLAGYTGLCPIVRQSGGRDDRGSLAKNGPEYLRWALIEAATDAARHPAYKERCERNKRRCEERNCHEPFEAPRSASSRRRRARARAGGCRRSPRSEPLAAGQGAGRYRSTSFTLMVSSGL